jgi:folate-binding protein YgfZ
MNSPLTTLTREYGAVYSTYSDWEMPAHYDAPRAECQAAHASAVLRDASHWGRFLIGGKDHLEFLHRMSTNDFVNLKPGTGLEAVFPDNRGRVLEMGTFYRGATQTLAVLSPPGRERLPTWLDRYIFSEEITLEDVTMKTGMIELSGPQAADLTLATLDLNLNAASDHQLMKQLEGTDLWLVRIDRFGHPGLRVVGPAEEIPAFWEKLLKKGAHPMGEEAFEILRIEAGLPLYERELTEDHNPWEAGLDRAIHMDKGCYIGQEVIARLDTYDKVKQHLMGLIFAGEALPSPDTPLLVEGREAGKITSAAYSPHLGKNIALAYVRNAHCTPGTLAELSLNGAKYKAEIVALPFASGA